MFAKPPTPIPKPFTGSASLVDPLNRMEQCILERTPIAGNNITIDYTKFGFRIHGTPGGGKQSLSIEAYSILAVHADYLDCCRYDISTGAHDYNGTTHYIAKYWDMQATKWNGLTIDGYSYTGYSGTSNLFDRLNLYVRRRKVAVSQPQHVGLAQGPTEEYIAGVTWDEMVWPPYHGYTANGSGGYNPGAIIVAFDLEEPIELPALSSTVGAETFTEEAKTIRKMELPVRQWLPVEKATIVCVNGNTRLRMMIRGSNTFALA